MKEPVKERRRSPSSLHWKSLSDEEKKQCIVDAVLQLVAKHGVHGTTTARIAAMAGVSEPTIYRTFKDRRDMLLAAADAVWQQRKDEMEAFEAADAMDYLKKLSQHHTEGIQKTRVVRFLSEMAVAPPSDGLREHLRDKMLQDAQHLAQVVEEGKAQGCIHPEVDSQETGWRIMGVYWVEAMARLYGLEEVVLTGFTTKSFESILREIATDPSSISPPEA